MVEAFDSTTSKASTMSEPSEDDSDTLFDHYRPIEGAHFFLNLMPGPPPFSAMNSTISASSSLSGLKKRSDAREPRLSSRRSAAPLWAPLRASPAGPCLAGASAPRQG
jgi:hypothetical protein